MHSALSAMNHSDCGNKSERLFVFLARGNEVLVTTGNDSIYVDLSNVFFLSLGKLFVFRRLEMGGKAEIKPSVDLCLPMPFVHTLLSGQTASKESGLNLLVSS